MFSVLVHVWAQPYSGGFVLLLLFAQREQLLSSPTDAPQLPSCRLQAGPQANDFTSARLEEASVTRASVPTSLQCKAIPTACFSITALRCVHCVHHTFSALFFCRALLHVRFQGWCVGIGSGTLEMLVSPFPRDALPAIHRIDRVQQISEMLSEEQLKLVLTIFTEEVGAVAEAHSGSIHRSYCQPTRPVAPTFVHVCRITHYNFRKSCKFCVIAFVPIVLPASLPPRPLLSVRKPPPPWGRGQRPKPLCVPKPASNFGPMHYISFPRKMFLMWVVGWI